MSRYVIDRHVTEWRSFNLLNYLKPEKDGKTVYDRDISPRLGYPSWPQFTI